MGRESSESVRLRVAKFRRKRKEFESLPEAVLQLKKDVQELDRRVTALNNKILIEELLDSKSRGLRRV